MINIKYIIKGWYNKLFLKEQELADYRLKICNKCEHNVKVKFLDAACCNLCGCVLDAKVRVREEKCLNNK